VNAVPGVELLRELGSGGVGVVWLARITAGRGELPAGRLVACKRLLPALAQEPLALAALAQEAELGARLEHPSLLRTLEYGETADGPYLLSPYLPGPTLRELLDGGGPVPEPLLRAMGAELAEALDVLHRAGVVHGDVTPRNVRLDDQGRAVLLDLGLAHQLAAQRATPGGTLAYSSPEVLGGEPPAPAADIFALGTVLYELSTGGHPFGAREGADPRELMERLQRARVAPPSRRAPRLSPLWDALVDAALRRRAAERPTASALAAALRLGEAGPWWQRRLAEAREAGPERSGDEFEAHFLPFVGRGEETAALLASYARLLSSGRGEAVLLRGPGGVGKARLVGHAVERLRTGPSPCLFLAARCTDANEARSVGTPLRLLEHWLQLPPRGAIGPRGARLLGRLVPPREAEALVRALDPTQADPNLGSAAVALADWLAAVAREQPVVVLISDLQRARVATFESLRRMLERSLAAPVLLVLCLDDDRELAEPQEWEHLQRRLLRQGPEVERSLSPLGRDDLLELVTSLFHHSTPRLRLARVLWERSRGSPALVEELLQALLRRGDVEYDREDQGRLVLHIGPDELPLPSSLRDDIRARRAELPPLARRWLERLSVAGGRIEPQFLCRAFPPSSPAEVSQVLRDLQRSGWLEPRGERYRFTRPALRQAIYRTLSDGRRQRLHRMVARAFLAEAEPSAEHDYQAAFHLRAAGEHQLLLEVIDRVASSPALVASPQRLASLARFGLEAIDALGDPQATRELERRLLDLAIDAVDRLGQRQVQRAWLDRYAALYPDPAAAPRETARSYLAHGRYAYSTGDFGLARGMLRAAVEFGRAAGDAAIEVEALRGWALVEAEFDSLAQARTLSSRALAAAETAEQRAGAHLVSARVELLDDRVERALADVAAALQSLRSTADAPGLRAAAFLLRARIWRAAGGVLRALGAARRALALAREAEDRGREAETAARLGWLLLDADRPEEAEAQLREAQLLTDEIEDRRARVLCDLWLGILLWEQDAPEAQSQLTRALELADEIGFHRAAAVGHAVRARIRLRAEDSAGTLADSLRALDLLERHGAELTDRIVIVGTRALVLETLGQRGESRRLVRELRERMRATTKRIRSRTLARAQRGYTTRLLAAVLTLSGPIYPRTSLTTSDAPH
jgi:tetratricopeptide (TPR) repeat protein